MGQHIVVVRRKGGRLLTVPAHYYGPFPNREAARQFIRTIRADILSASIADLKAPANIPLSEVRKEEEEQTTWSVRAGAERRKRAVWADNSRRRARMDRRGT